MLPRKTQAGILFWALQFSISRICMCNCFAVRSRQCSSEQHGAISSLSVVKAKFVYVIREDKSIGSRSGLQCSKIQASKPLAFAVSKCQLAPRWLPTFQPMGVRTGSCLAPRCALTRLARANSIADCRDQRHNPSLRLFLAIHKLAFRIPRTYPFYRQILSIPFSSPPPISNLPVCPLNPQPPPPRHLAARTNRRPL